MGGQSCSLHAFTSLASPSQSFPPFRAAVTIERLRISIPLPQVFEHLDQPSNSPHLQSTVIKKVMN